MENVNIEELSEALNEEFKQIEEDREALRNFIFLNGNDAVYLPVNVPRLVWNAKEKFRVKPHIKTDLDPLYVIEKTRDLLNSMSKEGLKIY
jgi:DNA-directed RNA polymerase II subunit RPB1